MRTIKLMMLYRPKSTLFSLFLFTLLMAVIITAHVAPEYI